MGHGVVAPDCPQLRPGRSGPMVRVCAALTEHSLVLGRTIYLTISFLYRFLIHDPNQRLGANGAAEVKAHPFFKGVNWDSLALQKAVFVPQPESVDDTSYFLSRFSQISSGLLDDQNGSYSDADTRDSSSNSRTEMDECGDLAEFGSCPLDLSLINFSFKNLSQLASINHEVLVQNVKDSTRSSPAKDAGT
ncbi:hypothetical protein WN944_008696 [Citrus x changshan-huyou]|uniref:non-specific serine/threonine protein kinase n=1 Tax=Citrus x changshan-huyou TaxID=2935761 RepID=A0AAP0MNE7_9ROSI